MDKATLRPHVFEILKMTPQTHFHAIENEVRRRVETYERHDVLILQELLWELLLQGVLAPGKNSLNLNLPFVHVTEYGATCLDDGRILVHDPDAYMARLVASTDEQVDAVVIQLVREALEAFLNGNRTASIVMLSLIGERLFELLARVLVQTEMIDKPLAETLGGLPSSSGQRIQAVIRAVQECSLAPEDEAAALPHLNGLATPLQLVRTDTGTPRWIEPSHDQVLGLFLLFPEQCAFVYHLEKLLRKAAASG
jgi:hypothetical protein